MRFGCPPTLKRRISALSHSVSSGSISCHPRDGFKQASLIVVDEPGLCIVNHFGQRSEVACDCGSLARERLDENHAEGLIRKGRDDDGNRMAVERPELHLCQLPEEEDAWIRSRPGP